MSQLGSTTGQIVLQCLRASKFNKKNPDQSVLHCWGQRSSGVSWDEPESNYLEMPENSHQMLL